MRTLPAASRHHHRCSARPSPPACSLAEVIDEAEAKDGEVDELHKKKREVRPFQCFTSAFACYGRGMEELHKKQREVRCLLQVRCGGGSDGTVVVPRSCTLMGAAACLMRMQHLPMLPSPPGFLQPSLPSLQVKSAHADLRDLCSLMSGQMGRFRTLLEYARRGAQDLGDKVAAAGAAGSGTLLYCVALCRAGLGKCC